MIRRAILLIDSQHRCACLAEAADRCGHPGQVSPTYSLSAVYITERRTFDYAPVWRTGDLTSPSSTFLHYIEAKPVIQTRGVLDRFIDDLSPHHQAAAGELPTPPDDPVDIRERDRSFHPTRAPNDHAARC